MNLYTAGANSSGQLALNTDYVQFKTLQKIKLPEFCQPKFLSCGDSFSYVVTTDNGVLSAGENEYGQLSRSTQEEEQYKLHFVECQDLEGKEISTIACGGYHVLLASGNHLFACGRNTYGQLGIGNDKDVTHLTCINTEYFGIKQLSCGTFHTFLLLGMHTKQLTNSVENGTLLSCGRGLYGQLGHKNTNDLLTLTQVPFSDRVEAVSCGYAHTIILTKQHQVYCCGRNDSGQCGQNDTDDKNQFLLVQSITHLPVSHIFAGGDHSILLSDGAMYAFGKNESGQLGLGLAGYSQLKPVKVPAFTEEKISTVACTHANHTVVLTEHFEIYSAGSNNFGQLAHSKALKQTQFKCLTPLITHELLTKLNIPLIATGRHHTLILTQEPLYGEYRKLERSHRKSTLRVTELERELQQSKHLYDDIHNQYTQYKKANDSSIMLTNILKMRVTSLESELEASKKRVRELETRYIIQTTDQSIQVELPNEHHLQEVNILKEMLEEETVKRIEKEARVRLLEDLIREMEEQRIVSESKMKHLETVIIQLEKDYQDECSSSLLLKRELAHAHQTVHDLNQSVGRLTEEIEKERELRANLEKQHILDMHQLGKQASEPQEEPLVENNSEHTYVGIETSENVHHTLFDNDYEVVKVHNVHEEDSERVIIILRHVSTGRMQTHMAVVSK